MTRVFVSSISQGLEETRVQIISDLTKAGYDTGAMEQFGAQSPPPIEVCLREVRRADVLVLIVGPRYGSLLPQGISYTQAEYREARSAGIPVLAFRVPDEPALTADDKDRIASFLTEVGSTTTYDSLAPGESLDRLSPKVLAALTSARDRGELAGRFALFQRYDRFFAPQMGGTSAIFNHEGPYIGRDTELHRVVEFIRGNEPLLVLKAPGGSGKSRLLLEAARDVATNGASPAVLFVDSAAQWTAEDINHLPVIPTVLVFDDAHRRPDLDRLIAACQQQNAQIRCIVSCRPSAVGIVKPLVARLIAGTEPPDVELQPLAKGDAEALARHYLGPPLEHLADRLVRLADRNPLVIRVGARCIAEKLVVPEILERAPEAFRTVVLDRLLDDPGLRHEDAVPRRAVLEVIAAVGPVVTEADDFIAKLATSISVPDHVVRRLLAALERAGFLIRRGRLVRVSPDVLADHLLYRAAVDENGRPTGFVEAMIGTFGPTLLANVLANAAELDWRASATSTHEPVLSTTWRDMLAVLPQATIPQRAQLVAQLKRAAIFAPEEVLRICEWVADHPGAPPDEELARWGLDDKPERVVDALTDVIALIATHPDFTNRCVERLWAFAASDQRPTNPNPGHPRRRLEDLVKYERRSDWQSSQGVQVQAIAFLIERLRDPKRTGDAPWAVAVLGSALSRLGEANEANRRQFTIRQFSLAHFLDQIAERRNTVIGCLRDIALGPRPIEATAALHELGELLHAPRGPFGQNLSEGEVAAWQPEAELAIAAIHDVANGAASEVVRFLARRQLREVSRQHWPQIAQTLENALKTCPSVANEQLYDLLVGIPWEEQLDDYKAEEQRVGALCDAAARTLWEGRQTASAIVETLLVGIAAITAVATRGDSQAGRLVRSIVASNPNEAESVIRALVAAGESGWQLLRPALLQCHEQSPARAEALIATLCASDSELLRAYAADAMQWMIDRAADEQRLLEIARRLSGDPSVMVRRVVTHALRRFRERAPSEALKILTSIEWSNDLSLGNAVLDVLHPKYGLDPNALPNDAVDQILARIEGLQSLEGRAHDVLEFIAFASTKRPRETVEMLLRRIAAVDAHSSERGEERWTPIPYNGHGMTLPGLSAAADSLNLLRLIRDAALGASVMVRFWLPELFHVAATNLDAALLVLREWVDSGEEDKIVGAAYLLRGFDHEIVFSAHGFVADLLDAAANCGHDCLGHTSSELYAAAISGMYSGSPGQPAPRHLSDKAQAQSLVEHYAGRSAVRDFYESLVDHAEGSIRRELQEWDEEGDDE
jgi:hypothetical protein